MTHYNHQTGTFTPDGERGLVVRYARVGSGALAGLLQGKLWSVGDDAETETYEWSAAYTSASKSVSGDYTVLRPFVSSSSQYTTSSPPDGVNTTDYFYTFYSDEAALVPKTIETRRPLISVDHNGPGRPYKVTQPTGTITRTEFEPRGLVKTKYVGTNDPDGPSFGSGNMELVWVGTYDGDGAVDGDGGDDDGDESSTDCVSVVVEELLPPGPNRIFRDARGHELVILRKAAPHVFYERDNVGRVTAIGLYDNVDELLTPDSDGHYPYESSSYSPRTFNGQTSQPAAPGGDGGSQPKKPAGPTPPDVTITIDRQPPTSMTPGYTPGKITVTSPHLPNRKVTGDTMEPPKGPHDYGKGEGTKNYPIPAGTYDGGLHPPHKFSYWCVEVLGVKGFKDILIHSGNEPSDSTGCIMVGTCSKTKKDWIDKSREKRKEIDDFRNDVKKQIGRDPTIKIIIKDPPSPSKDGKGPKDPGASKPDPGGPPGKK